MPTNPHHRFWFFLGPTRIFCFFFFFLLVLVRNKENNSKIRKKRKKTGEKERERYGEKTGRGIRLFVQSSINRRFGRREIEPPLPIYSQRVLLGVQVHHWRRVCHPYSPGPPFFSLYSCKYTLSAHPHTQFWLYLLRNRIWSRSLCLFLMLFWLNLDLGFVRNA